MNHHFRTKGNPSSSLERQGPSGPNRKLKGNFQCEHGFHQPSLSVLFNN